MATQTTSAAETMERLTQEIMEKYSVTNREHVLIQYSDFYGRTTAEVFNGDMWYVVGFFEKNQFVEKK